jgi:hypothetical protein
LATGTCKRGPIFWPGCWNWAAGPSGCAGWAAIAPQKNPHPKRSFAYAAWVRARLGGWTGYYGKPGPTAMLEGWLDFQAAKRGVAVISSQTNV